MSDERERGPEIIDAHQELVSHIEKGAGVMRALSLITIAVAAILVVSYVSQLGLALMGTTTVTVNLTDPANIAAELIVLALVLVWLYVGIRDLRFSTRMRAEIGNARLKEKEIRERVA